MYTVILNTKSLISRTLYPDEPDYTPTQVRAFIQNLMPPEYLEISGRVVMLVYKAPNINEALRIALSISNALLQDAVAVQIRKDGVVVLQTLCGLNVNAYEDLDAAYFRLPAQYPIGKA